MASRSNKTVRYAPPTMASAPKTPPRSSVMNSVRSSVQNRRPAATSSVVRGIAQNVTDRSGNRLGPRRQVGQADPATRRAALDAALRPGPPVKAVAPKPVANDTFGLGGGIGGKKRAQRIDDYSTRTGR